MAILDKFSDGSKWCGGDSSEKYADHKKRKAARLARQQYLEQTKNRSDDDRQTPVPAANENRCLTNASPNTRERTI